MLFNVVLLLILVMVFVSLFKDGLCSNLLTLVNAVTAGLVATSYFEPASVYLSDLVPSMDYNWDVVTLGVIFAATYLLLRQIALQLSKYQVRFHPLVDQIGGGLVAVWVGWVAVCFVTFALHTSPLARNFLKEGFQPEQRMFFGLAPDRQWLGFATKQSSGGGWGANQTDEQGRVTSEFDPQGTFLVKYASRRKYLESHPSPFAGPDSP